MPRISFPALEQLVCAPLEPGCRAEQSVLGKVPGRVENVVVSVWECLAPCCSGAWEANLQPDFYVFFFLIIIFIAFCFSGGLEEKSIPIKSKAQQDWAWEFPLTALIPCCSKA